MFPNFLYLLLLVFAFACSSADISTDSSTAPTSETPSQETMLQGTTNAPDFPQYVDWLNTRKSYKLSDFAGHPVLLDFWTYCCINCMHVLPDLRKLEEKYPELVVIGVHSAKFEGEKSTQNIREAILRYDIEHPVINDYKFEMWQQYAVRAWPTLVLIDPGGKVIGQVSGEGNYETLDRYIGQSIDSYRKKGQLATEPLEFDLIKSTTARSILSFPAKLDVDSKGKRIFISDSNNDRIVVIDANGKVLEVIGYGAPGVKDGNFGTASFYRPQGVLYDARSNSLYIADTENHSIRKADLNTRTVTTLLGTGEQARGRSSSGKGKSLAINSPWDLAWASDGKLLIAMAGPHQLWQMDTATLQAEVYAGSGREDIYDASRLDASLAQPSGITVKDGVVYFADSETSSIRKVEDGKVITLIGSGLFDFGDKDGAYTDALLQHPLGVFAVNDNLFVADTYNNKIKKIDLKSKKIATVVGGGTSYTASQPLLVELNEPNDIALLDGNFFITDTNHGLLRKWNPRTNTVSIVELNGIEKFRREEFELTEQPTAQLYLDAPYKQKSDTVQLIINPIKESHFNLEAPQDLVLFDQVSKSRITLQPLKFEESQLIYAIPASALMQPAVLQASLYYCTEEHGSQCFMWSRNIGLQGRSSAGASNNINLALSKYIERQM